MIDILKGRYWDEGIELVSGCTPCSPGCDHCWSAAIRHRFQGGLTKDGKVPWHLTNINGHFNGYIETHPKRLSRFNTRKPKVFAIWNDLFHEDVPFDFIDKVYESISMVRLGSFIPNNTYLILTKRPQQLIKYINNTNTAMGTPLCYSMLHHEIPWNSVWHGLTVCNQQEADEKIPIFLQVPGKKFLSIEPMLEKIDLSHYLWFDGTNEEWFDSYSGGYKGKPEPCYDPQTPFEAVICGGETGPGARPMSRDWVRSVRDQCQSAGVPFFFKQWGEWSKDAYIPDQYLRGTGGGDDPRYDQESNMMRVGRAKAGRLLDGREWNDLPWVKK